MDGQTWDGLVTAITQTHAQAMGEGVVIKPHLFVFTNGCLVGFVQLRPVYRGKDAIDGIAEMSNLAAAVPTDEVVAAWETADVVIACELAPLHPQPGLNIVWAASGEHLHYRFPYQEQALPGRTEHGLIRATPDGSTPRSRRA
ncbi:MAG: hypothetical protein ACRDRR_18740 [Pseudonocardiaceae bacterium]